MYKIYLYMLSIKRLIFETGKTQSEIGDVLGLPQSAVSNMSKGFRQIRPEHIARLKTAFGDELVNRCMIPDDDYNTHESARTVQATILSADVVQDLRSELAEDAEVLEPIPIVSIEQAKTPDLNVKDLVLSGSKDIKTITWPEFIGKLAPFDVIYSTYTDRMTPLFVPGEFLFIKYLHPKEGEQIMQGVYLIDTKPHGSFLCRLRDNHDGTLTASFDNCDSYEPITYSREDVSSIGEVAFSVRLGELTFDVANVADLKAQRNFKDEQIRILTTQLDKQGDRANRLVDQMDRLITIVEQKNN